MGEVRRLKVERIAEDLIVARTDDERLNVCCWLGILYKEELNDSAVEILFLVFKLLSILVLDGHHALD